MGHYDDSRPGYCGKCGAAPGNMRDGICMFCDPQGYSKQEPNGYEKVGKLHRLVKNGSITEDEFIAEARRRFGLPEVTDRDVNLLKSCADWLSTRSDAPMFKNYSGLMKEYAASLRNLRERIEPQAVSKPVTLDEVFGKKRK